MPEAQPGQEQRMVTRAALRCVDGSGIVLDFIPGRSVDDALEKLRTAATGNTRPTADLGELEPDGTGIDTSPGSGNSPEEQRADVGGTQLRKAANLGEDGDADWLRNLVKLRFASERTDIGDRIDRIADRLILYSQEIEALKHDIHRALDTSSELATENVLYREALVDAREQIGAYGYSTVHGRRVRQSWAAELLAKIDAVLSRSGG